MAVKIRDLNISAEESMAVKSRDINISADSVHFFFK